jgi:hypothetical protein
VPAADPFAAAYIRLGLQLDQLRPGILDTFFGPAELKARAEIEPLPAPARLAEAAAALRDRLPAEVAEPDRARWFDRQLAAVEALAIGLTPAPLAPSEELRRLLDANPVRLGSEELAAARAELDALLPGGGSLTERLADWDAAWTVSGDHLARLLPLILDRLRLAVGPLLPLPAAVSVAARAAARREWSGYASYDGGYHSRVEISTDLPRQLPEFVTTLAHETYPGHHLDYVIRERDLVEERERMEATLVLTGIPQAYLDEALAELGPDLVLGPEALSEIVGQAGASVHLGGDREEAARAIRIEAVRGRLRLAGGEAVRLLMEDGWPEASVAAWLIEEAVTAPDRATRRVEAIQDPGFRVAEFGYGAGWVLLEAWCGLDGPERRLDRFRRLLSEQLTPSSLEEEVAGARGVPAAEPADRPSSAPAPAAG